MELEVPDEAESAEAGAVTAEAAWSAESGAAAGKPGPPVAAVRSPRSPAAARWPRPLAPRCAAAGRADPFAVLARGSALSHCTLEGGGQRSGRGRRTAPPGDAGLAALGPGSGPWVARWIRTGVWVRLLILEARARSEPRLDACGSGKEVLGFGGPGDPIWGTVLQQVMETSDLSCSIGRVALGFLTVCGLLEHPHSAGGLHLRTLPACLACPPCEPPSGATMLGCQCCKCHLLVSPCCTPLLTHLWTSVYRSLKRGGEVKNDVDAPPPCCPGEQMSCQPPRPPSPFSRSAVLAWCEATQLPSAPFLVGRDGSGPLSASRAVCTAQREQKAPFEVTGTFRNHKTLGSLQQYPVADNWLGLCGLKRASKGLPDWPYQTPGREEEPRSQWSTAPGSQVLHAIWSPAVAHLLLANSHLPSFSAVTSCLGAVSPVPY